MDKQHCNIIRRNGDQKDVENINDIEREKKKLEEID